MIASAVVIICIVIHPLFHSPKTVAGDQFYNICNFRVIMCIFIDPQAYINVTSESFNFSSVCV